MCIRDRWKDVYKSQRENNTKAMYSNIIDKHLIILEGVKDVYKRQAQDKAVLSVDVKFTGRLDSFQCFSKPKKELPVVGAAAFPVIHQGCRAFFRDVL